MRFKAGDLVRGCLSKRMGIVVSVRTRIDTLAGKPTKVQLCRIYWPSRETTTETNSIWLLPYKEGPRSLTDEE